MFFALSSAFLEPTSNTPISRVALAGKVDAHTMVVAILRTLLLRTNFSFVPGMALANTIGATSTMASAKLSVKHRTSGGTAIWG